MASWGIGGRDVEAAVPKSVSIGKASRIRSTNASISPTDRGSKTIRSKSSLSRMSPSSDTKFATISGRAVRWRSDFWDSLGRRGALSIHNLSASSSFSVKFSRAWRNADLDASSARFNFIGARRCRMSNGKSSGSALVNVGFQTNTTRSGPSDFFAYPSSMRTLGLAICLPSALTAIGVTSATKTDDSSIFSNIVATISGDPGVFKVS